MLSTSPIMFPEWLGEHVSAEPPTLALVAGADAGHVLEGVCLAAERGWLDPVLIGPKAGICQAAGRLARDVSAFPRMEAVGEAAVAEAAASRIAEGGVGMIVKGNIHTGTLLRALLRAKPGIRAGGRLFHVWLLTHPEFGRPLAISDGALNPALDLPTAQAILNGIAGMFRAIGRPRPRIALLAATEERVAEMPATLIAGQVADWAASAGLDAEVFGPLAMDAAISPEAAGIKGLPWPAGAADALVVPSIEVGNVLAKALIWMRSACAAGVVLGGRMPVVITSRSDSPAARLASVALARALARQPDMVAAPVHV